MKISTLSIVAGTGACNASCPFCVSKMTGNTAFLLRKINHRNLNKAILFAEQSGVSTVLITGKGEPTLYPDQITEYLTLINNRFPFIELQTNGLTIERDDTFINRLSCWRDLGLSTVSISIISDLLGINGNVASLAEDVPEIIRRIHSCGLSVRINCTLIKDILWTPEDVKRLCEGCKKNGVEQLTIRPVAEPEVTEDKNVSEWVEEHTLSFEEMQGIEDEFLSKGKLLMELPHGAQVVDYQGQNLCINNCLTLPVKDEIRQLIFFPDGHLYYDWTYKGAILL
jgi:molybdenum cofactor biosynthesis enzyme MoaA